MSKVYESLACHACGSPTTREEVRSENFYYNACENKYCEWRKAQTHWNYERPVFKEWNPIGKGSVEIADMEATYSQQ